MTDKYHLQPSRYKILGLVGRGQFGRVFCARNRKTSELVALKELDPQRFPTNKLLRELRFLLALQHDNIVSCISLEHSKSGRYLIMEYCNAGTLRDLIAPAHQLTLRQCIGLVVDILSGLEHAHNLNIIHCDIKPENVLLKLTETGWQAKVSDFGIAKLSQENDRSGGIGSPGYMAPERFYGQFSVGSDLYAVGIILYELLLKNRPFTGKPAELMIAHINQRVEIPPFIPLPLQAILTKSLQKLPGRRFTSAAQMRQELLSAVALPEVQSFDLAVVAKLIPDDFADFGHHSLQPIYLSQPISEQGSDAKLVALAANTTKHTERQELQAYFYSATKSQLQRHKLSAAGTSEAIAKFKTNLQATVIHERYKYVVSDQFVYSLGNNKNHILHKASQSFLWAISPKDDWIAIASGNKLDIKNLINHKVIKVDFSDRNIAAIIALDNHYLAVIARRDHNLDSRIFVVSRRGNIMWKFNLPARVGHCILSYTPNRLLITEENYPNYLMLIDLKPYRLQRSILDYTPHLMEATKWGYVLATEHTEPHQNALYLLDSQAQNAGCLIVDGKVTAIACINDHLLAISTDCGDQGKLYLADLKNLDVDLIF